MKKRTCEGVVVGKDESTKGYKMYLPSENKVIVTRHVQDIRALDENSDVKTPTALAPTTTTPPAPRSTIRRFRRLHRKSRRGAEADGDVEVDESRLNTEPAGAESAPWAAADKEELEALQANST
ncbi:hypothetical protein PInf_020019 [Phytophthora infestans]|nr:hypothetical protein PInf_020019 [Phytophthora infestans]